MIVPMTKYSFVLLSSDKDSFLSKLRELGVVDITRSSKPVDERSSGIVAQIEAIKSEIKQIQQISSPQLTELLDNKKALTKLHDELAPWGEYDISRLAALDAHFFRVSPKAFRSEWQEQYPLQIVQSSSEGLWFVVLGSADGIAAKELPAPERTAAQVAEELAGLDSQIEACREALRARASELPSLEAKILSLTSELNLHLASLTASQAAEGSISVFEGFAPSEDDAALAQAFGSMDIYYIAERACSEDKPPIKLRNSAFVRQFEVLTRMYGMPVYDEFDPSVFLSIFFLLFFSICMGDAGYGIALVIVGLLLKGKKGGLANMWSLIVTLGVGTILVGTVMGGFFGINLAEQSWIPMGLRKCMITGDIEIGGSSYAKQMVMALGVGIVHLCLAMITKVVWSIRRVGLKHSLSALGWALLIVGGILCFAIGAAGILSELSIKFILIAIAALSALGIYFFNRWGKNPLSNLGAGLWDTYNMASGLMGDVLSYIRLYALALSGGMLGQTFNQIAEMVKGSDPTWQWIPFVLIVVLGHAINLAMSCLGAFVHPLRLNFVEFFKNSGYEGKGAEYKPLQ